MTVDHDLDIGQGGDVAVVANLGGGWDQSPLKDRTARAAIEPIPPECVAFLITYSLEQSLAAVRQPGSG